MLKIVNDLFVVVDGEKCVLVVFLDMRAAFDTVNHTIFLKRLDNDYGISGTANAWF